jgi:hypothetical protein
MRFAWADRILAEEMSKGRSLMEIRASGELPRIGGSVNNATGWAKGKFAGSIGDLAMFAPRFFQSRLAMLAKGFGGILPGSPIDQRLARQAFASMIGWGTILSVSLNKIQGRDTDFHPFLDGNFEPSYVPSSRKNPNFMRVRAFGRDWSLFGPWDSIAGLLISVGGGNFKDAYRTMASGPVQVAWDFLSGQKLTGENVPQPHEDPAGFASWLAQSHLPFATEEGTRGLSQIVKGIGAQPGAIRERVLPGLAGDQAEPLDLEPGTLPTDVAGGPLFEPNVGEIAKGAAGIFGAAFGIKSAPVTPVEERNMIHEQIMAERGLEGKFFDQEPSVIKDMQKDTRLIGANERVFDYRRGRGKPYQAFKDSMKSLKDDLYITFEALQNRWTASLAGEIAPGKEVIFGKGIRKRVGDLQKKLATDSNALREKHEEDLEFLEELDPPTSREGQAQQAYIDALFDPNLEDFVTGFFNFGERERRLDKLKSDWGEDLIAIVESTLRDSEHPLVTQLREDRDKIAGYFDIRDTELAKEPPLIRRLHEEYMRMSPESRETWLEKPYFGPLKNFLLELDRRDPETGWSIQQQWIIDNGGSVVDDILLRLGYRTSPTSTLSEKRIQEYVDAYRGGR